MFHTELDTVEIPDTMPLNTPVIAPTVDVTKFPNCLNGHDTMFHTELDTVEIPGTMPLSLSAGLATASPAFLPAHPPPNPPIILPTMPPIAVPITGTTEPMAAPNAAPPAAPASPPTPSPTAPPFCFDASSFVISPAFSFLLIPAISLNSIPILTTDPTIPAALVATDAPFIAVCRPLPADLIDPGNCFTAFKVSAEYTFKEPLNPPPAACISRPRLTLFILDALVAEADLPLPSSKSPNPPGPLPTIITYIGFSFVPSWPTEVFLNASASPPVITCLAFSAPHMANCILLYATNAAVNPTTIVFNPNIFSIKNAKP